MTHILVTVHSLPDFNQFRKESTEARKAYFGRFWDPVLRIATTKKHRFPLHGWNAAFSGRKQDLKRSETERESIRGVYLKGGGTERRQKRDPTPSFHPVAEMRSPSRSASICISIRIAAQREQGRNIRIRMYTPIRIRIRIRMCMCMCICVWCACACAYVCVCMCMCICMCMCACVCMCACICMCVCVHA